MSATRYERIKQLREEITGLQERKSLLDIHHSIAGLGIIEKSFAKGKFPFGALHEFISYTREHAASTNGFITGILSTLMQHSGPCLWISNKRTIFPPALKLFDIAPERMIFIDLFRNKEILWTIEEALKCESVAAVIGELGELSFNESRRFQLAIEKSCVTGFIHRFKPHSENPVACISRWKVTSIASYIPDSLPGVGFPKWHVQLTKVRNGMPGEWEVGWNNGCFHVEQPAISLSSLPEVQKRKAS